MTNAQLLLSIGIPSLTVLVGILLNNRALSENSRALNDFKSDVTRRLDRSEAEVTRRLDRIEGDLREFYKITSKLETKVEYLERKA